MNPDKEKIDAFGQFLIENLYDQTLSFYEHLAHGQWKALSLLKLQAQVVSLDTEQQEIIKRSVTSAIDYAIHNFLFQLHEIADNSAIGASEHSIQIFVDGTDITTLGDGLQGELYAEHGWIVRYSQFSDSHDV